ncbi:cell wall associated fibronectin-binding protein, partial [Mycoplasmopsis columbina SF7]
MKKNQKSKLIKTTKIIGGAALPLVAIPSFTSLSNSEIQQLLNQKAAEIAAKSLYDHITDSNSFFGFFGYNNSYIFDKLPSEIVFLGEGDRRRNFQYLLYSNWTWDLNKNGRFQNFIYDDSNYFTQLPSESKPWRSDDFNLDGEIVKVEIVGINKDERNGFINLNFKLTNGTVSSTVQTLKFDVKSEGLRLNQVLYGTKLSSTNTFSEVLKQKFPSELTKTEIYNVLNNVYKGNSLYPNSQEVDLNTLKIVNQNDEQGELTVSYRLNSTKSGLTDINTQNSRTKYVSYNEDGTPNDIFRETSPDEFYTFTFTDFWNREKETNRLTSLANQLTLTYENQNRNQLLDNTGKLGLTIGSNSYIGTSNLSVNVPKEKFNLFVGLLSKFEAGNKGSDGWYIDNSASVTLDFRLESTRGTFPTNSKILVRSSQNVSGFITEQQRLNRVLTQRFDSRTPGEIDKNRTVNQVTNSELLTALKQMETNSRSDLAVIDPGIQVQKNETSIIVTYRLRSTKRLQNNADEIIRSKETRTKIFDGFQPPLNEDAERQRLTQIANASFSGSQNEADYSDKTKLITETDFTFKKVSISGNIDADDARKVKFVYDPLNGEVNKLTSVDSNVDYEIRNVQFETKQNALDRNGKLNITFDIYSKRPGYENVKISAQSAIYGFKRESQRLNELIQQKRDQIINSLFTAQEKNALPSSITKATLKNKLDAIFRANSARVEIYTILKNNPIDASGELEIDYRLLSNRESLNTIQSDISSGTLTIPGFYSTDTENQRISDLVSKVTSADYQNKANVLAAKEFSNIVANTTGKHQVNLTSNQISKLSFTINDGDRTYTSRFQNGRLEFPELEVYVKSFYTENFTNTNDNIDNNGTYEGQLPLFVALGSLKSGMNNLNSSETSSKLLIKGFKPETIRLTEVQNSKATQVTNIFTATEKSNRKASSVTIQEVEEKLKSIFSAQLTESNALISNNSIGQLIADDANGRLAILITTQSTRDNLTSVRANDLLRVTITGFVSEQTKLNYLINHVESVSYSPKNFLLNYPTQTLNPTNLIVKIRDAQGTLHTSQVQNGEVIFPTLDMKLSDVVFAPLANTNDATGTTNVTFKLQTTLSTAGNAKSATSATKQLTGFKREQQRLNELLNSSSVNNDAVKARITNFDRLASRVSRSEIVEALNIAALTNADAKVTDADIVSITANDATGILLIRTKIRSARENLTNQTSSNAKTFSFRGFLTKEQEKQRITNLGFGYRQIIYKNSQNIVPSDSLPLDYKQVEITFAANNQEYVAKYQPGQENKLVIENGELNIEITDIVFTVDTNNYESDKSGIVPVSYKVRSTKSGFEDIIVNVDNRSINNFKTEQRRINELFAQNLHNQITFNATEKAKLASQITDQEIQTKFSQIFNNTIQGNKAQAELSNIVKNDQNGTIVLNYTIHSTKNTLTDIYPKPEGTTKSVTFSGFATFAAEKTRLNSLNPILDYANKNNTPQLTSLIVRNILWKLSAQETNIGGEVAHNEENVRLSDVTFLNQNDRDGSLQVRYRLNSTKPGYSSIFSDYKTATISNFLTEAQRLTNILEKPENDPSRKSYLRTAFNNKVASQVTREQVLAELNKDYQHDQSQIDLNSIQLNSNDATGTLSINYKLVSKRTNLNNVYSTKTKTVILTNLRSNTSETNRVNNIANNLNIDYPNKDKTPLLTSFDKSQLNITIEGEKGVWNSDEQAFVFTNNNVKIKDINFKNQNDLGNAQHADNTGSVDVEYKVYSTITPYATNNIQSQKTTKTISGFQSEQQRINAIKDKVAAAINPQNFTIDKRRTVNQVNDSEIINLLKTTVSSDDLATVSSNPVITKDLNAGTITAVWNVASTREGFKEGTTNFTQSQNTITTTISGFITAAQEEARIQAIKNSFTSANYNDKNDLVTNTNLVVNDLTAIFNYENSTATFAFNPAKEGKLVTTNIADVEISNIQFATPTNVNDQAGSVNVTFELHSTKPGFENIKQTITTTLTGFKTEAERLSEAQNTINPNLDLSHELKAKPASAITKSDIKQAIVNAYRAQNATFDDTNSLKTVNDSEPEVTLKANDEDGTLEIKYVVKSTRSDLTNVYAPAPITKVFRNFVTRAQELERLNNLVANLEANAADYTDKSSLPSATNLSRDNLNVTIQNTTQSAAENSTFAAPINAKVVPVNNSFFSNLNDRDGSIKATIKLQSTIFADLTSTTNKEFTISGFKNEQKRLNEVLVDRYTNAIRNIDYPNKTEVIPSTITKQQIFDLLNPGLRPEDKAKIDIDNIKLTADNQNGTLAIEYKLISLRDGLTDIVSSEKQIHNLSGFKTTADEVNRLNALANKVSADYTEKNNTPSTTTKDKSKLKLTIDGKIGTYDPESDSIVFDAPINAKATNITFDENNDKSGTFSVNFKLVSTIDAYANSNVQDSNESNKKTISGLQTEQERLDAVLTAKSDAINNADFAAENKNKAPSTISDNDILTLLNNELTSTDSTISSSDLVETINKNNETGEITVKFKTHSTRDGLNDVQSSQVVTKVFRGFRNKSQVENELNNLVQSGTNFNIDYKDKTNQPTATTFTLNNLMLDLTKGSTKVNGTYANDTFTLAAPINAKIEEIVYSDKNDANGSVSVKFKLRSTEAGFETIVSDYSEIKTITNFRTEVDRLNSELPNHATNSNVTFDNQAAISAETITKAQVVEKLNTLYQDVNAKVAVDDITEFTPNDVNGTLSFTYKLTSTRPGLTDQKSSETRTLTISGFLSSDQESARLEELAQNATVDYNNKATLMADKNKDQLNLENLKVTINNQVGVYNPETRTIEFNEPINAKITAASFSSHNDRLGGANVTFKLQSTKAGLDESESANQTKAITGFKTEQTRLDQLVTAKESQLNDLQDSNAANKTASQFSKADAATLLNTLYTNDEARVREQDVETLEVDNNTGQVTVTYKVNSTRSNLDDITSSTPKTKVFTGFITEEQERARLSQLLNKVIENLNYTDKDNWPSGTTFTNDNVTYQVDNQTYSGLAIITNENAQVTNIAFTQPNDKVGSENIAITLTSTRPGFTNLSVNNLDSPKTVTDFKTEVDRLNRLLNTQEGKQPQAVDVSNVSPTDKASKAASTYSISDISTLLNNEYQSSQAQVSDVDLHPDNQAGTLTINYTLTSTKDNLSDVKSSETKQIVIRGFKSEAAERARLDQLLDDTQNITATYNDKVKTPLLTNFNLENLTLTINNVQGTFDTATQSFSFGDNVNAKASEITFINKNDENGTVEVQIGKLTSLIDGYANVDSTTDKHANKTIEDFLTESQRLDALVNEAQGVTYSADADKNTKLATTVTKADLTFATFDTKNNWYKLLATDANLEADDKTGTLTITVPLTSTRTNLTNIKSSQERTIVLSGFKTAYQDATDNLNNLDQTNVSISSPENANNLLPNSTDAKNVNSYTATVNGANNVSVELVAVVGHNEISGKTLVAYRLVDNDPAHTDTQGQKPTSKVFFKVVEDFETEVQRLTNLKTDANNNYTYTNSAKPKASTFASATENSDFALDNAFATENKVTIENVNSDANDQNGSLNINYQLATTKDQATLFGIDESLLGENQQAKDDLRTFAQTNFRTPEANDYHVTVANNTSEDGFLTFAQDLDNKIADATRVINTKENLSSEEKAKLITDLNAAKTTFNNEEATNAQNAYNKAKETIATLANKATTIDDAKAAKIPAVNETYPHLNQAQREQVKANIKQSNTLDNIQDATLPTTTQVEEEARALNAAMSTTANNVAKDATFQQDPKFTSAPQNLKDEYLVAIQAAKDLIPATGDANGANNKVPNLDDLTSWSSEITKPDTSNYNKAAVDELNRVIANLVETITSLNEAKEEAKDAIEKLEYLSEAEKTYYKGEVDKAATVSDVNSQKNAAIATNETKKGFYDRLDDSAFANLPLGLKNKFKEEIKNNSYLPNLANQNTNNSNNQTTFVNTDNPTEASENTIIGYQNLTRDAYDALKTTVDAQNTVKASPVYQNATSTSQTKYNDLVEIAQAVLRGENPDTSKYSDMAPFNTFDPEKGWNAENVNVLNDAIQNALVEAAKSAIDNSSSLGNLSQNERDKLKEQMAPTSSLTDLERVYNEATTLNAQKQAKLDQVETNYEHLNTSQKEAVKEAIKTSNLDPATNPGAQTVADVETKAAALDDSMEELATLKDKATSIKASEFYTKSTPESKAKYDSLIDGAAKLIDNEKLTEEQAANIEDNYTQPATPNWDKTNVDKLNEAIKNALKETIKKAIENGFENLSQDEKDKLLEKLNEANNTTQLEAVGNEAKTLNDNKQALINQVNNFEHLNDSQKMAAKQAIKDANYDPALKEGATTTEQVVNKYNELNNAMKALKDLVNEEAAVKASEKYINAQEATQTNYDNLVQAGKDLIANNNPIDEKVASITSPNGLLVKPSDANWDQDAVEKLIQGIKNALKQAAKDAINKLSNLSNNEKTTLLNEIDKPNANLDDLVDKAQAIDAAKKVEIDKVKALEYLSDDEKEKYSNDLKNKDTISSDNLDFNEEDQTALKTIENKAEEINQTKKNHYDQVTANYPNLNASQQDAVREAIKQSNLEEIVGKETPSTQSVLDSAQTLNTSMGELRNHASDSDTVKASPLYTNSTPQAQANYEKLIAAAKELTNNTNPSEANLAPATSITRPEDANWTNDDVVKLNTAIKEALKEVYKATIDGLSNLSDDEKQAFKNQLETSNNPKTIADKASQDDQTKGDKIAAVDANYQYLNQTQKDAVKEAIKQSNLNATPSSTNPTTSEVEATAEALNQAMKALHDFNDKAKELISNGALNDDVTQTNKDKFNNAQNVANDLINNLIPDNQKVRSVDETISNTTDQNWNKADVDKVTAALEKAIKEVAKDKIDALNNLSQEEKEALKNKLDNAETRTPEDIQNVLDKANQIEEKKQEKIDEINKLDYLSDDEKVKYASDVKGENLADSNDLSSTPTLDSHLEEAQETNNAKKTKDNELVLNNVNQAQRAAITQAIKDSNLSPIEGKEQTPATNDVINNAQALDDAMGTLKDLKNAQPNVVDSNIYAKASEASKDAYNKLIEAAKELINNSNPTATNLPDVEVEENDANWPKTSVDKLNEAIINALKEVYKSAIDKLENLSDDEKTAAKEDLEKAENNNLNNLQTIGLKASALDAEKKALIDAVEANYPHLNASQQNAVKEAIKGANKDPQLSNGNNHPTVADVQTNAQNLDGAMEKLANLEADKEITRALPAYLKATEESKAKYEKLIAAAKELLTNQKPSSDNIAPIEENFANPETANWAKEPVDKLNKAIEDSLKEIYLSAIDEMPYLSDEEKAAAKEQINNPDATKSPSEIFRDVLSTNNDKEQEIQNVPVNYPHLNNAQQEAVKKAIKNANKDATLNPASPSVEGEKAKAQALDNSMATLAQLNDAKTAVKDSDTYAKASEESKAKYEKLTSAADELIKNTNPSADKLEGTDISKDDSNWDKKTVDKLNDAIIHALKEAYKTAIDNNNNLSQDEKADLKDKLNNEETNTLDKVNEIANKADEINDAKEDIINNLATTYPNLNQAQRDAVKEAIQKANLDDKLNENSPKVSEVQNTASALNEAMGTTRVLEAAKELIHASDAYTNATSESQNNYDKLIEAAKELINNQKPNDDNVAPI